MMLFLIASYFPRIFRQNFAIIPVPCQLLRDRGSIIGDRVEEVIMSFTPTPEPTLPHSCLLRDNYCHHARRGFH